MWRGTAVGGVEEAFAERVGDRGTVEALIEKHRTIWNGVIELPQGWKPALGPQVRVGRSDGGDPFAVGGALPVLGEPLLHLSNRAGAFDIDGVVAYAIGG